MRGQSAPKPPDPYQTAGAQTGQSIGTAIANQTLGMVNQVTPNGSLTYNQTGVKQWTDPASGKVYDLPQYTATQTLSPEQQRLQGLQTQGATNLAQLGADQSKRLGSILSKPMSTAGAPGVSAPTYRDIGSGPRAERIGAVPKLATSYNGDFSADRKRVEDAIIARANPQMEADRRALESRLANQGIQIGTEAYDRAMQNQSQAVNDFRLGAILSGGQEQSRMVGLERDRAIFGNDALQQQFDNNLTRAGFNNAAGQQEYDNRFRATTFNNNNETQRFNADQMLRDKYLAEAYAARNQPINEIGALLGTGQVQSPNFVNTPTAQMPTTDLAGLINSGYQNKLGAWQQQNQQRQGTMGGLFGLGSSLIMGL